MAGVKIAVPNKGRLSDGAARLLEKIGLRVSESDERRLIAEVGKGRYQLLFVNAKDIPEYVELGVADVGITGRDLIEEQGKAVKPLLELNFGECRLTVAVSESSGFRRLDDVPEGATVATSFPNLTRRYFAQRGKRVEVVAVSGATEITPHIGVADLITDLVDTGSTLRVNRLRPLEVILESRAIFIANPKSLAEKPLEIGELTSALESVVSAEQKRYLMANVPKAVLDQLPALLPGISGPTIMPIMGRDDLVAIHAVTSEDALNGVITVLKSIGATGILVVPIERMVI